MKSVILFCAVILSIGSCNTSKSAVESNQSPNVETMDVSSGEWGFCQCVVALDSITFAVENDKLSIQQEAWLMERWEFVDQKCKEIIAFDNSTPLSRSKHEKRVRECLE